MTADPSHRWVARKDLSLELLWEMTGWPPQPAWERLGLSLEAREHLEAMHHGLSVLSHCFREAPAGDYTLAFKTGVAAFEGETTLTALAPDLFMLEVLAGYGPRVSCKTRNRINAWCAATTKAMEGFPRAGRLFFIAGQDTSSIAIKPEFFLPDIKRYVTAFMDTFSPALLAQLHAAGREHALNSALPSPATPPRVRL